MDSRRVLSATEDKLNRDEIVNHPILMIVPFAPKGKLGWSPVKLFQKEQHMS